jgi:hypothetical protein
MAKKLNQRGISAIPAGEKVKIEVESNVKAFVKCNCGYIIHWRNVVQLLSLILSKEKYTCPGCGTVLDFVTLYICSRELGAYCESCEFRFRCFAADKT